MRKALKTTFLIIFGLVAIVMFLVVDFSPTLSPEHTSRVDDADSVQVLLNELRSGLRNRYNEQVINVSQSQANSLAGFIHRALKQARAKVEYSQTNAVIQLSYQISNRIVPMYINIFVQLDEGDGVRLNQVNVGSLAIPGNMALWVAESLANSYTSSLVATKAIDTVKSVDIDETKVSVTLQPIDGFLKELKNIETGGDTEDTKLLKSRIAHYLNVLDDLYINQSQTTKSVSLVNYLQAVFAEATLQSRHTSAILENEAAILALAIYAGSYRFSALTGDLSPYIDKIPQPKHRPVLKGREDLSLHFVFSAAIKLLSQKGISIAVGEFKELMDRGKGGSGYSFVDLAADLAGAHFAELAVQNESAIHVQQIMSLTTSETAFMVSIDGLDEGLSKAEFEAKYSKVDSPEYLDMVDKINKRIAQLPISI